MKKIVGQTTNLINLVNVMIGLVVIILLGLSGCAEKEVSILSSPAMLHYRNGWLKHLGNPTGQQDWQKKAAEKAVIEFQKAIKIEPENVIFRQSLAFAFEKLGQTAEAEEQYKKAIKFSPQDSFLHFAIGRLYAKNGITMDKAQCWNCQTMRSGSDATIN